MAKRHSALIPLTHDHHHALGQARQLIEAAKADAEARKATARSFLDFYREDSLLHFREEEEVLLPPLFQHLEDVPEEAIQVLVEHVRIHGMAARLKDSVAEGVPEGEQLKELGETLRAHVRLEEDRLFPLIEETLSEEELVRLAFRKRDRKAG